MKCQSTSKEASRERNLETHAFQRVIHSGVVSPRHARPSGSRTSGVAGVAGSLSGRSGGRLDGHGHGRLLGLGGVNDLSDLGSDGRALGLGDAVRLGGDDVGDGGANGPGGVAMDRQSACPVTLARFLRLTR